MPERGARIGRRAFLATGLGALAFGGRILQALACQPAVKPRPRRSAKCDAALAIAKGHILRHCASLDDTNGAIHGLRALGRELPLGADPFRTLLEACVSETGVGSRAYLEIPAKLQGHRGALLKTFLERDCPRDLAFEISTRQRRFQECLDDARALHRYPGGEPVDEHSWAIMAFALTTPLAEAQWTNAYGEMVDLQRMIDDTDTALTADTQRIRDVDVEAATVPRDCPVFGRVCGGMHMLYALAVALGNGYATAARRKSFAVHARTLVRRCSYDLKVIDEVERLNTASAGAAIAGVKATSARIKFLGHLLEIVGRIDKHGLYRFDAAERRALDAGRERLCVELEATRTLDFAQYASDARLYEDLTTDTCHAYNGLMRSPG